MTSSARRKDRSIREMKRKKVERKNDLIICNKSGMELGCGEAGLEEEEFDTKVILESCLKTPKIMYDLFVRNNRDVIKKLQMVGLIFSGKFKSR